MVNTLATKGIWLLVVALYAWVWATENWKTRAEERFNNLPPADLLNEVKHIREDISEIKRDLDSDVAEVKRAIQAVDDRVREVEKKIDD